MPAVLEALFDVWGETKDLHRLSPPANDDEIAHAEALLKIQLPEPLRELYRFSNGLSLNTGDLTIHSLVEADEVGSLVSQSDRLREWGWSVPAEALVFGCNGTGEPFALWVGSHDSDRFPEPIVEIGAIFEPGCMGLTAGSLASLLLDKTLEFLIFGERHDVLVSQLARLGLSPDDLPDNHDMRILLQKPTSGNEVQEALRAAEILEPLDRKVHPHIPAEYRDPYESQLDTRDVYRLLA